MEYRKVAVIGTGVIGASWATCFLSRGLQVMASDPAPGAEGRLRALVAQQWAGAQALGAVPGASQDNLSFHADPQEAVKDADFVQENGPERVDIKRQLFAELDAAAPDHAILASSSSGIMATRFQDACAKPGRVLIGHPFNPPHLIPLVEVVGGKLTTPETIAAAMAFYASIGKHPIQINKEVKGHIANRLQAALWREAFGLVDAGVATVEDIDAAISAGPGLRWAILGPFANLHLSGGPGGMQHLLDHLGEPIDGWWQDLSTITMSDIIKKKIAEGSDAQTASWDMAAVVAERDALLIELIRRKAELANIP
jgi:3-hydroxyacyl-CoA dehydrogenase